MAACGLGLALLVLAFRVGLLAGLEILFYRGLVVIAMAGVATFVILGLAVRRLGGLGLRDAFSAAIVSLALNVSFLVVVPVTVDRSISIFLLGEMAATPEAALTPDAASRLFKSVYVDDYRQIDRRLQEQAASGNLEKAGPGYRITARGRLVVDAAKAVAWMFDSRWGLAAPREAAPVASGQGSTLSSLMERAPEARLEPKLLDGLGGPAIEPPGIPGSRPPSASSP